jgi:hypothetical protein
MAGVDAAAIGNKVLGISDGKRENFHPCMLYS